MANPLLNQGSTIKCNHGGRASTVQVSQHVKAGGKPIVTQSSTYNIGPGCTRPAQAGGPCVTAQWTSAARRVRTGGSPVLLDNSQAQCTPPVGTLNVVTTQQRVKGT